jgi:hypothetical protein
MKAMDVSGEYTASALLVGYFMLFSCFTLSSTHKMDAIFSSEHLAVTGLQGFTVAAECQ